MKQAASSFVPLQVHLDDNLRRTIVSNPMCVTPASRCALEAAVWADTSFLASLNVMDYSLLVSQCVLTVHTLLHA